MVVMFVAYALVGVGIFSGRRSAGDRVLMALGIAVVWPVLALVGLGRNIA